MAINVLIVDDSLFFQNRLAAIIDEHPQLKVIGIAGNGKQALALTLEKKPDVITMDYEMPLMDGLKAVRKIMAQRPTPILMLSALTYEGAKLTLDALDAGAVDFMPKSFSEISKNPQELKRKLHQRLLLIARRRNIIPATRPESATKVALENHYERNCEVIVPPRTFPHCSQKLNGKIKLIAMGASTGGPVALSEILKCLPENFSLPILLIQHMPENFTRAFAERLNSTCRIRVVLAEDGMVLRPGTAYLAPGGQQMMINPRDRTRINVFPGDDRLNYKPSVDITLASAANTWGSSFMAMILTGMGSDGCEGSRIVKEKGGVIWSQDQRSSVIYGMPMAVARANLTDKVVSLNEIPEQLQKAFNY
ncbi:chemotaxis response regulator protein-glutamate methylesterase [Sessilibacter sp. MAH1]